MKQITRIDAINRILQVKTAERVSTSGELDTLPQAVEAGLMLDFSVVELLVGHKWALTDVDNGQLTTDVNGELILPTNLGFITVERTDAAVQPSYLVPIDGKLYDKYNHTYNLGTSKTVWYNGKLVWSYEELPAAFQLLAVAKARFDIVSATAHMSPTRTQVEKLRYDMAWNAAIRFDTTLSGGRIQPVNNFRRRPPFNRGHV